MPTKNAVYIIHENEKAEKFTSNKKKRKFGICNWVSTLNLNNNSKKKYFLEIYLQSKQKLCECLFMNNA